MVKGMVKVNCPGGLHMRPVGTLCKQAMVYDSQIQLNYKTSVANAKSVLSVLGACVKCGDEITLCCEGEDEQEALKHLVEAIESGLGEM